MKKLRASDWLKLSTCRDYKVYLPYGLVQLRCLWKIDLCLLTPNCSLKIMLLPIQIFLGFNLSSVPMCARSLSFCKSWSAKWITTVRLDMMLSVSESGSLSRYALWMWSAFYAVTLMPVHHFKRLLVRRWRSFRETVRLDCGCVWRWTNCGNILNSSEVVWQTAPNLVRHMIIS